MCGCARVRRARRAAAVGRARASHRAAAVRGALGRPADRRGRAAGAAAGCARRPPAHARRTAGAPERPRMTPDVVTDVSPHLLPGSCPNPQTLNQALDDALARLSDFTDIAFTSRNGVAAVLERLDMRSGGAAGGAAAALVRSARAAGRPAQAAGSWSDPSRQYMETMCSRRVRAAVPASSARI